MKEILNNDTITAISSPLGSGGIAVIRISGPQALSIAQKLTKKNNLIPRYTHYTKIFEASGKNVLDQGIVIYFQGKKSFTGEDTIEFHLHGSYYLSKIFLNEVIKCGARSALAGEFTQRAFLNGKIDLTQAEAISEMISTESEISLKLALSHINGKISEKILETTNSLMYLLSEIEAAIDYPDEINEPKNNSSKKIINKTLRTLQKMSNSYSQGKIAKDGIKITLIGKPNVGKSSLLNLLLKENRAIVTDIPGTTRDFIEEKINIDGINAIISDTAGLRNTQDQIEQIGIDRTRKQIETSDIILMLLDHSQKITKEDEDIFSALPEDTPKIIIMNKSDLNIKDLKLIENLKKSPLSQQLKKNEFIAASATTGAGEDKIIKTISKVLQLNKIDPYQKLYISSIRQKDKIDKAIESLHKAETAISNNEYYDLITVYLKEALDNLSEITKSQISDELMESIWSKFCVGK